jgi:hypothetical protein
MSPASLETWQRVALLIQHARATKPPNWTHVLLALGDDPRTIRAICRLGDGEFNVGCRIIADRNESTTSLIEARFREALGA